MLTRLRNEWGELVDILPLWWMERDRGDEFTLKARAMLDLWWFCREILGHKDLGEMHKGLCRQVTEVNVIFMLKCLHELAAHATDPRIVQELNAVIRKAEKLAHGVDKERMFLLFRGSFKTTIITEAHSLQLCLIYPNIRILIASGSYDMACRMLRNIRYKFMYEERLRALFPEHCPRANANGTIEFGNVDSCIVPSRWEFRKEGTIEAAGLESRRTGNHYDIIKKDDVINEKNVTNEDTLENAKEFEQMSLSLFDKPADRCQHYAGTMYHPDDIYCHWMRLSACPEGTIGADTWDGAKWSQMAWRAA